MLDLGQHHADVLLLVVADQARGAERTAGIVALLGHEQSVLVAAQAAVELDRGGDVAGAAAIVGRAADAARVQPQIGRASGREREWQYVWIPVVGGHIKKK